MWLERNIGITQQCRLQGFGSGAKHVTGHDSARLSVAQLAHVLVRHAVRDPSLRCRSAANSNEQRQAAGLNRSALPISLRTSPLATPALAVSYSEGMRRTADDTLRMVREAAGQAEEAAALADAAGRTARRGTLTAAGFGTLAALFCIAVVAASHINTQANAEAAKVSIALATLDNTQHRIDARLEALHAHAVTQAALVTPGDRTPIAPPLATTASGVMPRIAPVVPVAIKPLPPVTWSIPGRRTFPQDTTPAERVRADSGASPNMAVAEASEGKSG
jgi:hypothetical protein